MSKRPYRSKVEIIADILRIAAGGSSKTRIMRLGNLNFPSLQKYLTELKQLELIKVKNTARRGRVYSPTARGVKFLAEFKDMQEHSEIARNKKQSLENLPLPP